MKQTNLRALLSHRKATASQSRITFFSETSENDTEKPQPTIFKNKNLSLESLNPQALMLLQAYFAQTKTATATVKDNHVQSEPPSKVEVRKKKFNWNFSDANWQVWNRSSHCFAQRNKSELSVERLGKKRKRDFDLKSCHRAASFLFLP